MGTGTDDVKAASPRAFSKKTLARELVKFSKAQGLKGESTINDLLEKLRGAILVEDGVGDLSL